MPSGAWSREVGSEVGIFLGAPGAACPSPFHLVTTQVTPWAAPHSSYCPVSTGLVKKVTVGSLRSLCRSMWSKTYCLSWWAVCPGPVVCRALARGSSNRWVSLGHHPS